MKKLIFLLLILSLLTYAYAEPVIVRVHPSDLVEFDMSVWGISILNDEIPDYIDIIIEEANLAELDRYGIEYYDLAPISATGLTEIDSAYHTYEEFTQELQNFALNYPMLCKLDSIGRATQFPRTIWCMKLSDNASVEEDEPAVLYIGIHHASEVVGGETLLYMIELFLTSYGTNPEITAWMNNYEIYFVPLFNPDGHYAVTSDIDVFWRKNARDLNGNGIYYQFQGGTWWTDNTEGVDLNRNYDWYWAHGGSSSPRNYQYRGASPFSESENQAMRDLGLAQHFVCGITFHSYGDVVMIPWSFGGQPAPDQGILSAIGDSLAHHFIMDNGGYFDTTIETAYIGYCRNWFYGVTGALFYCVELMPYPLFIPPGNQLPERTQRYYNGAKYLLQRMSGGGITGRITSAVNGQPLYARVEIASTISPQVNPRYNEPQYGRYTRLLLPGSYSIIAQAPGYNRVRLDNVIVGTAMLTMDIQLTPMATETEVAEATISDDFKIDLSCSPNPFNSSLFLGFELKEASDVNLKIYDITGREVKSLGTGHWALGEHRVVWNAEGMISGVYFVHLIIDSQQSVMRKVVLIK